MTNGGDWIEDTDESVDSVDSLAVRVEEAEAEAEARNAGSTGADGKDEVGTVAAAGPV